jgi:hypothetical protein
MSFLDKVSGTQGVAGGADTVLILSRKRGEPDGLLQVTGRDVDDIELAVLLERPSGWQFDGGGLLESAAIAVSRGEKRSDEMTQLITFVNDTRMPLSADSRVCNPVVQVRAGCMPAVEPRQGVLPAREPSYF